MTWMERFGRFACAVAGPSADRVERVNSFSTQRCATCTPSSTCRVEVPGVPVHGAGLDADGHHLQIHVEFPCDFGHIGDSDFVEGERRPARGRRGAEDANLSGPISDTHHRIHDHDLVVTLHQGNEAEPPDPSFHRIDPGANFPAGAAAPQAPRRRPP